MKNMYCEPIYCEYFYRIIMRAKSGKKLYLKEDHWYGKNYEKINCAWSTTSQECLWFETEQNAKEFAEKYFTNFKNYEIEEFYEIM